MEGKVLNLYKVKDNNHNEHYIAAKTISDVVKITALAFEIPETDTEKINILYISDVLV